MAGPVDLCDGDSDGAGRKAAAPDAGASLGPRSGGHRALWFGSWAVGCTLLVLFPASVPGLHGDEAWGILRARDILNGLWPVDGMNAYTGPVFHYLAAPVLAVFGLHITALRLVAVGLNGAAVVGWTLFLRDLPPHHRSHTWYAPLILTTPFFVILSRFAIEVTALTPVATGWAGWLLVRASRPQAGLTMARRGTWASCAGLLLGLSAWNHSLAATLPLSILVACLVTYGRKTLRHPAFAFAAVGAAVGFAPRLVGLVGGRSLSAWAGVFERNREDGLGSRLVALPEALARFVHGDLLYWEYAGELVLTVIPTIMVTTVALLVMRFAVARFRASPAQKLLWVFAGAELALVTVVAPQSTMRYYEVALMGALGALVLWIDPLLQGPRRGSLVARGVLCTTAAMGAFFLGVNYFYPQKVHGGRAVIVGVADYSKDAHSFVDKRLLYEQIAQSGAATVIADGLIGWPLEVYDVQRGGFTFLAVWPLLRRMRSERVHVDEPVVVVTFNPTAAESSPATQSRVRRFQQRAAFFQRVFGVRPVSGFDSRFLVMMRRPP